MVADRDQSDTAMPPYGLTGTIQPTRLSTGYRLGLLVVAVAMLVLPLIYLGLIALVARVSWWHLSTNTWILARRLGGWQIVGYFGPAAAGAIMTFFMVKPILARPARVADPIPVRREDDPVLHAFIDDISRQVRAPFPDRVQVDCQVNASASFARFPWPLLRPSLTLTIGLPLAGGLSVRQLGGVIAHEFGHFAQGGAMRLTFIVRSINNWFSRVVYERDEWDQKLDRWSTEGNWMVALTMMFARAAVWCSRHVLRGLMFAGHGLSCFMLRQMEYDADSYEIKLVGSRTFLETSARMRELNVHYHIGHRDLHDAWIRKTLPTDLPAFLMRQAHRVPAEVVAQIREIPAGKAGAFDTHPTDADRAAAAESASAPGILAGGDAPATALFQDFAAVSLAATRHHYEHCLAVDLAATALVDTEQAVRASERREQGYRSTQAFYGEGQSWIRLPRLTWPAPAIEGAATIATLTAAREGMASGVAHAAERYRRLEALEHGSMLASAAEELLQCGFSKVIPADFELTDGSLAEAQATRARAVEQQRELLPELEAFEALADRRLSAGLALAARTATGDFSEAIDPLVQPLNALAAVWTHLTELYRLGTILEHVGGNVQNSPKPQAAAQRAEHLVDRSRLIARRLADTLAPIHVPAGVAGAQTTALNELLAFERLTRGEIDGTQVMGRAMAVRDDIIGRLTERALAAERDLAVGTIEAVS